MSEVKKITKCIICGKIRAYNTEGVFINRSWYCSYPCRMNFMKRYFGFSPLSR